MAERRKGRKKKEPELKEEDPKPSKEEYAVAKYLRQKLPEKKTTLLGHKVDYFIASKAIDCLLDSPWAINKGKSEAIFTTRESVVEFMDRMLQHKFFHRAKKIVVQKDVKKKKKDDDKKKDKDSEVSKKKESEEIKKKEKDDDEKKKETKDKKEEKKEIEDVSESKKDKEQKKTKTKVENEGKTEEKDGDSGEKKREKKKIKLDMHMEQVFVDGNEPYVWIYDPIPMRTWITGTLMVVGAVLICLFPLWPKTIRHYIYYLSIAAAGFLVFIIGLAVVRLVVFVVIWVVSLGKHHLWLLPNLTEDVGFFESFWPLYNYEYKGSKNKDTKEKKKESKDKDSETKEQGGKSDSSTDQEAKVDDGQVPSESEQESEGDKNKADNGDNGFEMIEVEESET